MIPNSKIQRSNAVALRIGDRISDLAFLRADSSVVTVAAFAGRPLVLIFLRHLA